jgi:hypothetical protein
VSRTKETINQKKRKQKIDLESKTGESNNISTRDANDAFSRQRVFIVQSL